jgi:hypothetical protein
LSGLPALPASRRQRESAITETSADHCVEVEQRPAVAAGAVDVQLVVVGVEAGEAAEVDHGRSVAAARLRGRAWLWLSE